MPINFCSNCAHTITFGAIEGDHLPRYYCARCGHIEYQNPKIIVGCVPIWNNAVMLCKRGIEPRLGFWNIPGGFMENNETIELGAAREMKEETGTDVEILGLHSIFSVPQVNQLHLHFLAEIKILHYHLTTESIEIDFFTEQTTPWHQIAFASTDFAIKAYFSDLKTNKRMLHIGSTLTHAFSPIY